MLSGVANPEQVKGEITDLLVAWSRGDLEALDKIFPLAFEDLRHLARKCCRRLPHPGLQPTELIGEIYDVLLKQKNVRWEHRGQFFQFAAFLMERVLLSYKRSLGARKRGGAVVRVPLIEALDLAAKGDSLASSAAMTPCRGDQKDVLEELATAIDVTEKIAELAELDPRQAEIARFRYLIGLTIEETAEILGISISTVKQQWRNAKRFLAFELGEYTEK